MKRIDETDIRKSGLVPAGHNSYKTAKQLLTRLSERYQKINISYKHCINAVKRQWQWKTYLFAGLEGNNCLLREIKEKPITEEEKIYAKQQIEKGNDNAFYLLFNREKEISEEITKIDVLDIVESYKAFQANIEVE